MSGRVVLRPKRDAHARALVSHVFEEWDTWMPYRMALCGREIDAERLTADRVETVPLCNQCQKHLVEGDTAPQPKEVSLT